MIRDGIATLDPLPASSDGFGTRNRTTDMTQSAAGEPAPLPRFREEIVRGVRWLVRGDAADALCAARALDVSALQALPDARVVEDLPGRRAFRATLPGRDGQEGLGIDVTVFRLERVRDLARALFHRARASRVRRAAERLEAAGLPAPRVLAAGTHRSLGILRDDVLIIETQEATPADALLDALSARERAAFVRRAAAVLGAMVRCLHENGLAYRGFEAADVLVRESADGRRQLLFGRLERLHVARMLPLGPRLDGLAHFAASLDGLSRADRRRFWKAYAADTPFLEEHEADYARLAESHAAALRPRVQARRERESVGANERFKRVRVGRWSGHTVRGRIEVEREVLTRIPARDMAMPDATVIKDSPEARVYEQRIDFGAGIETIIVKHKRRVGVASVLRTLGRRVGALAAWRTLWAMRVRGLSVEQPLAAFERRRCGLTFESLLVTRKVEGAENLCRFVERRLGAASADVAHPPSGEIVSSVSSQAGAPGPHSRRHLARALGKFVRRMHDAGFASRDLKAPNILVRVRDAAGTGGADIPVCPRTGRNACPTMSVELTLIDAEGIERHGDVPEGLRARDLGRLAADFARMPGVHATDLARCLDEYLAGRPVSRAGKRRFIALIRARVEKTLARHDAKRAAGRPAGEL